jgi:hypothetical protein
MVGENVAALHQALVALGLSIPEAETKRQFFGPGTREAVKQCQARSGLTPSGICDERTGALLHLPGVSEAPSGWLRPAAPAMPLLPEARPGTSGIEAGEETFTVEGKVVSRSRAGVGGLRIEIVDKNMRQDTHLAEAVTDADGTYHSTFLITALHQRGKQKPDLQARAFAGKTFVGASEVRYNASSRETLPILLTEESVPALPSEHETLTGALSAHFKGNLRDLKETDEYQDITYLANKTGWDARAVALGALADKFGEQSGIRPAFFYALFRTGLPANEAALSQMAPETVKTLWDKAAADKIIPDALRDRIPETLERFKAYSAGRLLQTPATAGVSSLNELLHLSFGADDGRKQRFARLYTENRGNLGRFWDSVREAFGDDTARRLQLDGKLALLTVNNATLMARLHRSTVLSTPLDLVQKGLYRAEAWADLLTNDVVVPQEIPGDDPQAKKTNYANFMASQLRLSYPTAVVAEMVKQNQIPLAAEQSVKEKVYKFLTDHQGQFELGVQPVSQYLRANKIVLDEPVVAELQKLQRVYQISPSDEAMVTLMAHNVDSAFTAVQYNEPEFVQMFKEIPGGETAARRAYHKAQQVHNVTLNIVATYLLQQNAPAVYGAPPTLPGNGAAAGDGRAAGAAEAAVLAYPTLEGLFGEMDYCACEHCRSWLSPAAYLVDLLLLLDKAPRNAAGQPLPMPGNAINPLDVLLGRRPDIAHLQLTCENTNTVLPYIDLVNEILEYYVVNGFSLEDFAGYNSEAGSTTEELLANPQYVQGEAYTVLQQHKFPPPLPFHQPLAALRRTFDHFDMPLHEAMERLRADDALDPPAGPDDTDYAWRDILTERLQLSREEYELLTNSNISLQNLYGDQAGMPEEALRDRLANARYFARLLDLDYEDLIEITRTRFVNPNSYLIPWLEKLYLSFRTISDFVNGPINPTTAAAFRQRLPEGLDEPLYGGDVAAWVKNNSDDIMGLILLTHPEATDDVCSFDKLELRHALPDPHNNKLAPVQFRKLLRFIRLWRKLGWSIAQTDKAITALYPSDQWPAPNANEATVQSKLDAGFKSLILRLAYVQQVMELLQLQPKRDLLPLLALWAPIDTHGPHSLYRQMFLNPAILRLDDVFQADATGRYLKEPAPLSKHQEALRAAFNLTAEELSQILEDLEDDLEKLQDSNDPALTVPNISAIFRRGYLARKLGISVRELLALQALSGLEPFEPPDPGATPEPVPPDTVRFIQLAQLLKESPFKISQLLYYLRHDDLSGKSSPTQESIRDFARRLRDDLTRIACELAAEDDPTDEVARARMALVYGDDVAGTFFGLLNNTSRFTVAYDHHQDSLQAAITDVTDRIAYDDFRKELSFRGVMGLTERDALQDVPGTTAEFDVAVDALHDAGRTAFRTFFDSVPDLEVWYDEFVTTKATREARIAVLLQHFLPQLQETLQRQQVRQTMSAELGSDLELATTLLETPALLHAAGQADKAAIAAFVALSTLGASARMYFADDVTGTPDWEEEAVASINYQERESTLPQNPAGEDSNISGVWGAFLQPPDNGFYNFYVRADDAADVSLRLDDKPMAMTLENGVWSNDEPVELAVGKLYSLELTAKKVKDMLVLEWASPTMARVPIPPSALYPLIPLQRFATTYVRLLKGLTIAEELELSAKELRYFGTHDDYQIDAKGWLNALPVAPESVADVTAQALLEPFTALLRYNALKQELKVRDDSLVCVLEAPDATTEDGASLLLRMTDWDEDDLNEFLNHFALERADLTHLHHFQRLKEAFDVVKTLGIGAATLVKVTTNNPAGDAVRNLQGALRARYDASAWHKVAQPINDALRSQQRDALVASILHHFSQTPGMEHIDTPDKLFEYFLIDVEMDPCMQTSRIKQAISTVQLFIQRCLLNLEAPSVAASSINAKQWAWMKRYRVWEANRKVFLFPENWLEPELRDDKSPFFRDLESELLQADITDDAAATALLHYLEKLDEVAKLEICGMYYEENEEGNAADDVIHVIGRTAGTRRTYYYRRLEGSSWTPWEKIDLNIEDSPVLPVVWQGRLFLFWLSVLQEGVPNQGGSSNNSASNEEEPAPLTANSLQGLFDGQKGDVTIKVKVTLYWSEYYNDKWQPPRTSDVNRPISLIDQFEPAGTSSFDRAKLVLSSLKSSSGELLINIVYPGYAGLTVAWPTDWQDESLIDIIYSSWHSYFKLYNTHSLPVRQEEEVAAAAGNGAVTGILGERYVKTQDGVLTICHQFSPFRHGHLIMEDFSFCWDVLGQAMSSKVIEPRHVIKELFEAPFFVQDPRHVFFVRPSRYISPVITQTDLVPAVGATNGSQSFLPMNPPANSGTVGPNLREVFTDAGTSINRLTGPNLTIRFGDRLIGPGGSITPRGSREGRK